MGAMTDRDWARWRSEFPILARKTYLNSCSLGALSTRAEARLDRFREEWHTHGASAWYETWMGRLDELRGRVARSRAELVMDRREVPFDRGDADKEGLGDRLYTVEVMNAASEVRESLRWCQASAFITVLCNTVAFLIIILYRVSLIKMTAPSTTRR